MKIKNLILILFVAFFGLFNYSSADVVSFNSCNDHKYEVMEKLPKGYVLLERYINGDNASDQIIKAKETLIRIGGQYGNGDYKLYLIPKSQKSKTEGRVGDDWIELSDNGFTTLRKRIVNQQSNQFRNNGFGYNNGFGGNCYPSDKEYLFEISLEGDGVAIIPLGDREKVFKRLSYYEKRYGEEKYKQYKLQEFILAYLLTILSETLLLWLICKIFIKENITTKKIILTGVLCSGITLPMLWYVFPLFLGDRELYVIGGEIIVLLIEWFIIKYMLKLSRLKALLVSFICNLASFILGIVIGSDDPRDNIESFLKAIIILIFCCLVLLYSYKKIVNLKELNQKLKLTGLIIAIIILMLAGGSLINFVLGLYL